MLTKTVDQNIIRLRLSMQYYHYPENKPPGKSSIHNVFHQASN